MASPSGTSSGSSLLHNSGSEEEDVQAVLDQKKRKRMISNRESARRSRMRKQKHLDDLMAQANELRQANSQLLTSLSLRKQQYVAVAAENSVLRAQMMELSSRLQSLDDILNFLNASNNINGSGLLYDGHQMIDNSISAWNFMCMNQPIMASAGNMFYY